MRLNTAPGRRTRSISSLRMTATTRVGLRKSLMPRGASSARLMPLDQANEELVEAWFVLIDERDRVGVLLDRLDDARRRGARVLGHDDDPARSALSHAEHARNVLERLRVDLAIGAHVEDVPSVHLAAKITRCGEGEQVAGREERHTVAVLRFADVLRCHDEGPSFVGLTSKLFPDARAQDRIDAGGGLVDEQHLRLMYERRCAMRDDAASRRRADWRADRGRPRGPPSRALRARACAASTGTCPKSAPTNETFSPAVSSGYRTKF